MCYPLISELAKWRIENWESNLWKRKMYAMDNLWCQWKVKKNIYVYWLHCDYLQNKNFIVASRNFQKLAVVQVKVIDAKY